MCIVFLSVDWLAVPRIVSAWCVLLSWGSASVPVHVIISWPQSGAHMASRFNIYSDLVISRNELEISTIQLLISPIHLVISLIQLMISAIRLMISPIL